MNTDQPSKSSNLATNEGADKKSNVASTKGATLNNAGSNTIITDANTKEYGGPKGLEPTRYGDWEKNGRCSDF